MRTERRCLRTQAQEREHRTWPCSRPMRVPRPLAAPSAQVAKPRQRRPPLGRHPAARARGVRTIARALGARTSATPRRDGTRRSPRRDAASQPACQGRFRAQSKVCCERRGAASEAGCMPWTSSAGECVDGHYCCTLASTIIPPMHSEYAHLLPAPSPPVFSAKLTARRTARSTNSSTGSAGSGAPAGSKPASSAASASHSGAADPTSTAAQSCSGEWRARVSTEASVGSAAWPSSKRVPGCWVCGDLRTRAGHCVQEQGPDLRT